MKEWFNTKFLPISGCVYALPRAGNGVRVPGSCANFFFFCTKKSGTYTWNTHPFMVFPDLLFSSIYRAIVFMNIWNWRKATTVKNSLSRIFESCSRFWHKGQFLSQFHRVASEIFRVKSCTYRVDENKLECLGLYYSKQEWSCKQYLSKFCYSCLNVSNYFSMKKDLKWNVFFV